MRGPVRVAFGIVGVLATLLGVLSLGAPSFVTGTEPLATLVSAASAFEPRTLFVVGSAAVALYIVSSVWTSPDDRLVAGDRSAAERFEQVIADPPETVTAPHRTLTGRDFDAFVERATAGDERATERVRDRLRRLALARLARDGPNQDRDAAEAALASGEWTSDRTAAAFLSGDGGPVPSLRSRIGLWLDPAAERERRISRTVAAIEELSDSTAADGERGVTDGEDADEEPADSERVPSGGVAG